MHWQFKMYNYGFERFHKMLEKFPRVNFLGHAQTWWANIDRNHTDQTVLYPKGPVTPGGLTDRYLTNYPNMYGDLSAGSGLNALTRDEDFTRDFVTRQRDKLLFGSDCSCREGGGPKCLGAQIIASRRPPRGRSADRAEAALRERRKRCFACDGNRYLGLPVSPRSHRDTETHGEFKFSDAGTSPRRRLAGRIAASGAKPTRRKHQDLSESGSCVCVLWVSRCAFGASRRPGVQHACFACVNSASAYPMRLRDSRSFCV